jgi:membrane-associated phospholipid phosphatase
VFGFNMSKLTNVKRSLSVVLLATLTCLIGRAQGPVLLLDSRAVAGADSVQQARATSTLQTDSLQSAPVRNPPLRWTSMFENIPGDWSRYAAEAFRTEKISEWLGITALTGFLILTDDATWKLSRGWYERSHLLRQIMYSFDKLGDGRGQFTTAGAFAVYGLLFDDQRALRTASQTVQAILAAGTIVQVLKHITGRESPFVATAPGGVWRFFPNQIEYHKHVPHYDAFPSGHIESSLATVVVIAENYPEVTWIRPVGYAIVGLIGIGMAHTGIHWYSDYPLGIALGYSFGMIAAHPERTELSGAKLSLLPFVQPAGGGVSFTLTF